MMRAKKTAIMLLAGVVVLCLFGFASAAGGASRLTIVHTNDVHSYVDIEPYVKSYVGELRKKGENVILVSAGDAFVGTSFAALSKGQDVVKVMNDAGYELFTLGNWEIDMPRGDLRAIVEKVNFPVLGANVKDEIRRDIPAIRDYVVKEYDGVKFGFLGVTWAAYRAPEGTVLGDLAVEAIERAKAGAAAEGATVFVAVTHLGVTDPDESNRSTYLADKCPWLSAIIDAHCHTMHERGLMRNGVLIAETGEYGANIGVVELSLADGKVVDRSARIILVKGHEATCGISPDPELSAAIAGIRAENDKFLQQVVGYVPFDLDGERETTRTRETALGNMLSDAVLWKTKADVTLISVPYIRKSLRSGDLTNETLMTTFATSPAVLYIREIEGRELFEMLENSLRDYPKISPWFKQVGGIRYIFDPDAEPGKRLVSVTLRDGTPVTADGKYRFAGHDAQDNWRADAVEGVDFVVGFGSTPQAFAEYLKSGAALNPEPDGRITPRSGARK